MALRAIRVPIPLVLTASLVLAGCGAQVDRPAGSPVNGPQFLCRITPAWQHHNPGVKVDVEIDLSALTFVLVPQGFLAVYETSVTVRDPVSGDQVAQADWTDSVVCTSYESTQGSSPRVTEHRISLEPGRYKTTLRLEDRESGGRAEREVLCDLPDVESGRPIISPVHLHAVRDSTGPVPVLADNLSCSFDSLSAMVETFNLTTNSSTLLEIHLLRGMIDTLPALPPTSGAPLRLPPSHGVFYHERVDTIRHYDVRFRPAQPSIRFALPLAPLPPGAYMTEFLLRMHDTTLAARRAFFVRGPTFPRPSLLEELIDPLVYIGTQEEMARFQTSPTPGERRTLFERFWLDRTSDPQRASQLIRLYYDRVDAANKQFTSHKEGWRTDRGMVMIVAGPPEQVERRGDVETWFYGDNNNRPAGLFQFKRVDSDFNESPLRNYVLLRSPRFRNIWNGFVEKWRSGEVR